MLSKGTHTHTHPPFHPFCPESSSSTDNMIQHICMVHMDSDCVNCEWWLALVKWLICWCWLWFAECKPGFFKMDKHCVAHCPEHYFGSVQAVHLASPIQPNSTKPLLHTQVGWVGFVQVPHQSSAIMSGPKTILTVCRLYILLPGSSLHCSPSVHPFWPSTPSVHLFSPALLLPK